MVFTITHPGLRRAQIMSKSDVFRYEVQLSFLYSIPWPKYTSAFDLERIGLFYCNSEELAKAYDLLTTQSGREITGRIFRSTSNAKGTNVCFAFASIILTSSAAPFRINRTPRASIRARQSISARNLKSALDKASLFSVCLNLRYMFVTV